MGWLDKVIGKPREPLEKRFQDAIHNGRLDEFRPAGRLWGGEDERVDRFRGQYCLDRTGRGPHHERSWVAERVVDHNHTSAIAVFKGHGIA
jgi:hypothetical protein